MPRHRDPWAGYNPNPLDYFTVGMPPASAPVDKSVDPPVQFEEDWVGYREKPQRLIAVDPGDVHVGVAFFESATPSDDQSWKCVDTQEMTPEEFEDALAETFLDGDIDVLVVEKFRLYGDKAQQQTGSEFRTSQLIGVTKYLHRMHQQHVQQHLDAAESGTMPDCTLPGGTCARLENRPRPVVLAIQPADIKKATAGILRSRKIKSKAKQNGDKLGHQVDAELHGYRYIFRTRHQGTNNAS